MTTATIYRENGASIEMPLLSDTSGDPVYAVDHGKPNLEVQSTGTLDPRFIDQFSGLESYTLLGLFTESDAYAKAHELADFIKSNSNDRPMFLDVDLPEFDGDVMVAPAASQEEAVKIVYKPGRRNWVEVDLGLTRVSETQGGTEQPAETPTASGSGPIELSYRGASVALESDITVERGVGRPKSVVRKATNAPNPRFLDKTKTAHDGFELSLEFNRDAVANIEELVGVFRTQLGRSPLQLNFNGVYGLGSFPVVPQGSGALRHVRASGEQGTTLVPKLSLRRVLSR